MRIGEVIKKLRKEKDMTQEQLAEYLNISPQAISRWEINSTLPDITLIPKLANIFDVTTDTLLGVDIDLKEKRIYDIVNDANSFNVKGNRKEALRILRDGLKEYPNSHIIKSHLTTCIQWNENPEHIKTDEQKARFLAAQKEIISIGESVLAECTEDYIRHQVISNMCIAYKNLKETEKAQALAEKMPFTGFSKNSLLSYILEGTKLHRHLQREIMDGLDNMAQSAQGINYALDDGSNPYTTDEHITILKKILKIYPIMFENEDYGFYNLRINCFNNDLAKLYLIKGDIETALKHLQLAVKHAIKFDANRNRFDKEELTSLIFRGNKCAVQYVSLPHSMSYHMIEYINKDEFKSIRNHEKVIEIIKELEKHAE